MENFGLILEINFDDAWITWWEKSRPLGGERIESKRSEWAKRNPMVAVRPEVV